MTRPDYIKCISAGEPPDLMKLSLCGRDMSCEFCFTDIDHAVGNARAEGRLITCKDCWNKVKQIMDNHNDN